MTTQLLSTEDNQVWVPPDFQCWPAVPALFCLSFPFFCMGHYLGYPNIRAWWSVSTIRLQQPSRADVQKACLI